MEGENFVKQIILLTGKHKLDGIKVLYHYIIKVTEIHSYTVIMSLNTAIFRSNRLRSMYDWRGEIYLYIYIYKEREREREEKSNKKWNVKDK